MGGQWEIGGGEDLDEHLSASNKPSALVSMKLSEPGSLRAQLYNRLRLRSGRPIGTEAQKGMYWACGPWGAHVMLPFSLLFSVSKGVHTLKLRAMAPQP